MDSESSAGKARPGLSPDDVPFIGWSGAAYEFRRIAAESAPAGTLRPLISGDQGVGKKTMARAWLAVGPEQDGLRFDDLDRRSFLQPGRFLYVTTYRPQEGRYFVVLGRGVREKLQGDGEHVSPLIDHFWAYFDLPLYMPPIRGGREIDVLAFLDYWNRARSARAGVRYRRIEAGLLRRMVFGRAFPNNLEGIHVRLRMLGNADRMEHGRAEPGAAPVEIETLRDGFGPGSESSPGGHPDDPATDWDIGGIPFASLPDFAVRMYLWSCQHPDPTGPGPEPPDTNRSEPLSGIAFEQFRSGLTAGEFLSLNEEQFLRDHVLPGVPPAMAARADCYMVLRERVRNWPVFGTTFAALQAGLAIDPIRCDEALGRVGEFRQASVRRGTIAPMERTPVPAPPAEIGGPDADPVDRPPDEFTSDGKFFRIVFHAAPGRIERGTFACEGNSGLAYYRQLIGRRTKDGLSPIELERGIGKHVDEPTQDESLDQEALAQYREELRELAAEIDQAKEDCDFALQEQLQQSYDFIISQIPDHYTGGKPPIIDKTFKLSRDRVRNAMKDALVKLHDEKMYELRDHLKQAVHYYKYRYYYEPDPQREWLA